MRKTLYAAFLGLALAGLGGDASLAQPAQCGRVATGASGPATTLIIPGIAGQVTSLCGWDITATATATFQIVAGTGATCGTGTFNITAAHAMAAGNPLATAGATPGRWSASLAIPPALPQSICMIIGGTGPVQWTVYYTQF